MFHVKHEFYFVKKRRTLFMIQFNHFNFNVLDLEKSLKFYKDTLKRMLQMDLSNWSISVTAAVTSPWNSPGSVTATNHIISVNANFILLS